MSRLLSVSGIRIPHRSRPMKTSICFLVKGFRHSRVANRMTFGGSVSRILSRETQPLSKFVSRLSLILSPHICFSRSASTRPPVAALCVYDVYCSSLGIQPHCSQPRPDGAQILEIESSDNFSYSGRCIEVPVGHFISPSWSQSDSDPSQSLYLSLSSSPRPAAVRVV